MSDNARVALGSTPAEAVRFILETLDNSFAHLRFLLYLACFAAHIAHLVRSGRGSFPQSLHLLIDLRYIDCVNTTFAVTCPHCRQICAAATNSSSTS
jgi:hypothetical protein